MLAKYNHYSRGFTIVELVVVIAVIAILAVVSVVSYGGWRQSLADKSVKNDLIAASAAMEDSRTFGDTYPLAVPSSFVASSGISISGGGAVDGKTYCIEGTSASNPTAIYYIDSLAAEKGPQAGVCASRPNLEIPTVPKNLAITSSAGASVGLSWSTVTNAVDYTAECASNTTFTIGMVQSTSTTNTTTVDGLVFSTTFYCRVRANSAAGSSAWSSIVYTFASNNYGSLEIATSIDGYWTEAPVGFLPEDGRAVSRTTYADLFAVIGIAYGGGDGSTTFNLPDSRGRTTANISTTDTEFDTVGEKTGSKTEALSTAQLPVHTHIQTSHNHTVNNPTHNHTQVAHSHDSRNNTNGDYLGMGNGSEGGWGMENNVASNNNIFQLKLTAVTAINYANTTGVTFVATTPTNVSTGSNATHNNIQPSIVKMSAVKYTQVDTAAMQLPAGTSISGYWPTIPAGYVEENGAAISRSTNAALFSAIGTTYGVGDGSTTFAVPDSRGRITVNKSTDTEFDTIGEKYGNKTEAISIAQMASHNHTQSSHTHTVSDPGHTHGQISHNHEGRSTTNGDYLGLEGGGQGGWGIKNYGNNTIFRLGFTSTTPTNNPAATSISSSAATATNQDAGSGSAHNNIQPTITKRSAIKTTGATTTGTQVAVGTSIAGYWTAAPTGYLLEDGSAVNRDTYASLFNVVGTVYGVGDGSTTFNLPDSRGRTAVNINSTDTEFDTMGEKPGSKTEALSIAQLASHTHTQNAHTHGVVDPAHNHTQNIHDHWAMRSPDNNIIGLQGGGQGGWALTNYSNNSIFRMITTATTGVNNNAVTGVTVNATTAVNQSNGSGAAHNEIQPSIVKLSAIKY